MRKRASEGRCCNRYEVECVLLLTVCRKDENDGGLGEMRRKWKKEQEEVPWEEFLFMRKPNEEKKKRRFLDFFPWVFQGTDRLFVLSLPLQLNRVATLSSSWNISEGKERQETLRLPVRTQVRTKQPTGREEGQTAIKITIRNPAGCGDRTCPLVFAVSSKAI